MVRRWRSYVKRPQIAAMETKMPKGQSDLNWSNISRNDAVENGLDNLWDAFINAKLALEMALGDVALNSGVAKEGDVFKFSYARIGQGTVGMAIDTPKSSQASGFGGLQRPKAKPSLTDWARDRDASGYRR